MFYFSTDKLVAAFKEMWKQYDLFLAKIVYWEEYNRETVKIWNAKHNLLYCLRHLVEGEKYLYSRIKEAEPEVQKRLKVDIIASYFRMLIILFVLASLTILLAKVYLFS